MPDGTQNCTSNTTKLRTHAQSLITRARSKTRFSAQSCVERKLSDHPCPRRTSFSPTPLFSALLQHGLLFAPRLLLAVRAAEMNERQQQASVTMRTRLVASECHLRDRSLSRIAALLKFSMLRRSGSHQNRHHMVMQTIWRMTQRWSLCYWTARLPRTHHVHYQDQKKVWFSRSGGSPFKFFWDVFGMCLEAFVIVVIGS